MNAQELFLKDGKSAGVFYCEKCRYVHRTFEDAERCHEPIKCAECGKELTSYPAQCNECFDAKQVKIAAERFEKAEKLKDWDGPVFCESFGSNEGYFDNLQDLIDEAFDEEQFPPYCWACTETPIVSLDYNGIIEDATQEANENFSPDDLDGEKELKVALEAFNKANARFTNWHPDYTKAILTPTPP